MAESLHVGGILVLIIVNPFPMANKAGLTRLKADADFLASNSTGEVFCILTGIRLLHPIGSAHCVAHRNIKLSCRRQAAQCFVSFNILLIKSLQAIGNDTIRKLGYGFLFAFQSNYDCIFICFDAIHERDRHTSTQLHRHRTTA